MIEILLFALIVYGLFNLMKGGVYFIKAVAKLVTAFYYIFFNVNKGYEKTIFDSSEFKEYWKKVNESINSPSKQL